MATCDLCGNKVNLTYSVRTWDKNFAPSSVVRSANACKKCVAILDV